MDGKPHVHEPSIQGPNPYGYGDPTWYLVYGDTRVLLSCKQNPYDWQLDKLQRETERALNEAIRRHDEGTQRAMRAAFNRECVAKMLKAAFDRMKKDRWASEQTIKP